MKCRLLKLKVIQILLVVIWGFNHILFYLHPAISLVILILIMMTITTLMERQQFWCVVDVEPQFVGLCL